MWPKEFLKATFHLFLSLFSLSQSSCLIEGVAGDGQKDIEQCIVSTQSQKNKIATIYHATALAAPSRIDGSVHYLVPIFTSQNLWIQVITELETPHDLIQKGPCNILKSTTYFKINWDPPEILLGGHSWLCWNWRWEFPPQSWSDRQIFASPARQI